jgi:hypothetical protein
VEPCEPVSVDGGSTAQRNLCVEPITVLSLSRPEATWLSRPPLIRLGASSALPWALAREMTRPVSPAFQTQGRRAAAPGDEKAMCGCTRVTGRGLCRAYAWGLPVRARKARNSCLNPLARDRETQALAIRVAGGLVERWCTPRRMLDKEGIM